MGPPGLRTLVTRQTDQITILTSQLEVSLAHNARLNARLFTALDTLDILNAELDAERRRNDKYLWMDLVEKLQREKDEMREVVELLIRKVERSKGDFDRWPSAMMFLPSPAGRSIKPMNPAPLPVVPPRMEALLHALSVERGRCRRATVSLQNAHETILTLEAQVARREAELESGDHRRIADVRPIPRKHGLFESLHPNLPDVPPSETVHSLAIAEEHNCVLEREVSLLNDRLLGGGYSPGFTSVAIQTSPLESEAPHPAPRSPPTTPTRTGLSQREARNNIEDLKARVDLLSNAINDFTRESRTTRHTLESRREHPDTGSDPSPSESPPVLDGSGGSQIPHPPPRYQLPTEPQRHPEPPSSKSPPHKALPDFQHILRVEQECLRLTRINERLESQLAELRTAASPVTRTSPILLTRSPALHSPALPTVSPSGFSVRSSGERDMDISTPLRASSSLPDNCLSDFDFFLGHTQPPAPNNASMNAEPPGDDTANPNSGISYSRNRPSSAPDMDDANISTLLSPFQLSASLPPRSKSAEPPSGRQERISET